MAGPRQRMHTCSKPCLNYFKQWTQQGNGGGVKISGRLKIRRCNVGPRCSGGKPGKGEWGGGGRGGNNEGDNKDGCGGNSNSSGGSGMGENDNKGKRGGGGRGVGL